MIIEFARWLLSPLLSSPLDVPVVFVGNGQLSSIGMTLTLLEALWSQGYRVDVMVFIKPGSADGNSGGVGGSGGIQFCGENAEALHQYVVMHRNQLCLDGD
jgi:hypothetical protein